MAWLKKPQLGTVPLFMAGDKQYFYYANKLSKELDIKLILFCSNDYERTNFKYGFSQVKPKFGHYQAYSYGLAEKAKLAAYYASQYLKNPSYLNSSLFDTLTAYLSYYFIPHDYLYLFRYINWDERQIGQTLRQEYNWELARDTKSFWRIGDGTAPFYNYIYLAMAGFTENDTFRSNQIRAGMISREEALKLVEQANQPRYDSIKWYCQTIGLDHQQVLKIIDSAPKLY